MSPDDVQSLCTSIHKGIHLASGAIDHRHGESLGFHVHDDILAHSCKTDYSYISFFIHFLPLYPCIAIVNRHYLLFIGRCAVISGHCRCNDSCRPSVLDPLFLLLSCQDGIEQTADKPITTADSIHDLNRSWILHIPVVICENQSSPVVLICTDHLTQGICKHL